MDEKLKKGDTKRSEEEDGRCIVIDRRPTYDDETRPGEAGPADEQRYPSYVEELKTRAEEAEARAREISTAYRRIDEEREAFRERLNRDLERRVDIARADLMRKMLGVVDDLERAIDAGRAREETPAMLDGIVLIRDQLLQTLASEGVEPVDTIGHPFDPETAEAIAVEMTEDPSRDNLVVEEMQRGYRLHGVLLRAARVKVARAQQAEADPDPPLNEQSRSD